MGRLFIVSGPSCVGKTPLFHALERHYPRLGSRLHKLVLYTSRAMRPGEKEGSDYYFRSRRFIRNLGKDSGFALIKARRDLQAVDLKKLKQDLKTKDLLFEGNPFVGSFLLTHPALKKVPRLSLFISPLSLEEVRFFQSSQKHTLQKALTKLIYGKLLRRIKKQKKAVSAQDLRDIRARAKSAYRELKYAPLYGRVVANHDGEDSDNWELLGYPIGEARQTLLCLAQLLKSKTPQGLGKWPPGLI